MRTRGELGGLISRRGVLKLATSAGLAGALGPALWVGGCSGWPGKKPNIVLMLLDTLRADHLACYGYPPKTMPGIDTLAKDSVLYQRVIAPSTWTKTSMASIMTATTVPRHGVRNVNDALPQDFATLAGVLKENGYQTIGVNTNPWLSRSFGFALGFDVYHSLARLGPAVEPWVGAWEVNREAAKLLGQRQSRKPVFLYLHYMDAHSPYSPEPPYFSKPSVAVPGYGLLPDNRLEYMFRLEGLDGPAVRQRVIELYDADLRGLDAAIQQMLDEIKKTIGLENTVVVITSDHGEEFREHGQTEHGKTLYPEVLFVPLIISWPGHLSARVVKTQVCSIDIAPALVTMAGVTPPSGFQGRALPTGGKRAENRLTISAVGPNDHIPNLEYVGVVSREYLYVHERRNNKVEFYDLIADMGAQNNLSPDNPKATAYAKIEQAQQFTGTKATVELDQKTTDQLKSLGYLR